MRSALCLGVGALAASLLHAGPARALPLETWVSSTGSGTSCSRAAPCATFQAAYAATVAGGQIGVVDSGDYGGLTITKAIDIVAEGAEASISAAGTTGITVAPGANDVVHIRGLIIDGGGTGNYGILSTSGAALHIEKCVIKNFNQTGTLQGFGIAFAPNTASPAELYVSDTVLTNNGSSSDGGAVLIKPSAAAPVRVLLNRVEANNNFRGIKADGSSGAGSVMNINVRDSVFSGSANNGIVATTPQGGATLLVTLDRITSSNNGPSAPASVGVVSDGPSSFIRIGNSTITGNWTGMSASNGGQLISFGNNTIIGNAADGSPTSVVTLK